MKKSDPEKALKNQCHEKFCQLYSGDYWGDMSGAYEKSGLAGEACGQIKNKAAKLLSQTEVVERIRYLRLKKLDEIADRLWVAQERKKIVESAEKESERLAALKDLEKGLGLINEPDKKGGELNIEVIFNKKDGTL
jgi:hypothetical protein